MISFTRLKRVLSVSMLSTNKKFIFSLGAAIFLGIGSYSQSVNMVVNPVTSAVTVGQNFTVDINVQFISGDLDVASVHLEFDNTLLAVVSATNAPSIGILPNVSFALQSPATMNTNGRVSYSAGTTGPFPSTNFTVISVTFQALQTGSTTLTFRRPPLTPPLTNAVRSGVSILNSVTNGTVNISSVGCTTPQATISAAPTCDASAFNLVLTSSSAGTAPFDLTIAGPLGTATYNDIPVGGVITNFTPPTNRLWPAVQPAVTNDDVPYTLGVRFSSSVSGFVRGVRFLTSSDVSAAPGNYTGQLWTNTGTLLASGTFSGPITPDSWQELLFTEPIPISAATTYVASYNIGTSNFYASTTGGLTAPFTNGPLTALAGGGVFTPGTPVAFPVTGTNNNYWADVIFSPNNYVFNLTAITDAGGCLATGSPNLQTLNVTSGECGTLPVSLVNFSATPGNNNVTLRWTTSSEINNLGFEVQRSIDGNAGWTALGFVNGAGNSSSKLHYSYVDENLSARRYYYRLKQVDIDQRFAYSPIVTAVLDGKKAYHLEQNYPNPFRNETVIRFTLPSKSKVNLSLFDMNGRLVKVLVNESKDSGSHAVTISSGMFTSGMYYYKLQAGDFSAVKKMTVQ